MQTHNLQVWTKRERERNVVPACGFIYRIILAIRDSPNRKPPTCWSSWPIQFQPMFTGPYYYRLALYLYPSSASLHMAYHVGEKTDLIVFEPFEFKRGRYFKIISIDILFIIAKLMSSALVLASFEKKRWRRSINETITNLELFTWLHEK